jgi:hypothetical protein
LTGGDGARTIKASARAFGVREIMARVIKPPAPLEYDLRSPSVFLAGSIEMGQAEDWQSAVEKALHDLDVVIFNPRRDEWDSSWVQSITNPQFRGQVEWELAAQAMAALVVFYFAPTTKAPVTLLELGLALRRTEVVVCCPDGFWRKGNVEVTCNFYGAPVVGTLDELIAKVRRRFGG